MIRKIRREEYLKGYGAMSDGERRDYLKRVGEWLAEDGRQLLEATERPMAKAQNIVLLSARWKEPEMRMFAEGVRLLSALMDVADTWLPTQLYAKSAYRAVRNIVEVLKEQTRLQPLPVTKGSGQLQRAATTGGDRNGIARQQTKTAIPAGKPQGTVTAGETKKPLPMIKTVSKEYDPATDTVRVQCAVVPVRPRHIDQYIHLLPEKTQEKAKQYGPLKREIEAARKNMLLLMDDPHSSAADRENWAKLAARNDEKIAKINAELDREWEKVAATGRVVVDDLGMAHLLPAEGEAEPAVVQGTQPAAETQEPLARNPEPKRKPGRPAMTEEEKKAAAEKRAEEKAAEEDAKKKADDDKRREYLKKWLRDTRTNPSDERRKQWQKNCKELLALGGEITESIRKAGEYYGVDMTKI